MTILAATFAYGGRVDDRHHLRDVFLQETIEESLVAVLQRSEEHIALEVGLFSPIVLVSSSQLLLNRGRMGWEQTGKTKLTSFILRKRAAFVKQWVVKKELPTQRGGDRSFGIPCYNRTHLKQAP